MSCSNGGNGSGGPWTGPGGNGVSTQIAYQCQEYLPTYPNPETMFSIIQTTDGKTWTLRGELPVPQGDETVEEIAYGNTICVGGMADGGLLLVVGNYWVWHYNTGFGKPIIIKGAKYAMSPQHGTDFTVQDFPKDLIEYINPQNPLGWNPLLNLPVPRYNLTVNDKYPVWWYRGMHSSFDLHDIVEFDGQILVSTLCYNKIYSTTDGLNWTVFHRDESAYWSEPDPHQPLYIGGITWGFQRMIGGPEGQVALLGIDGPYYLLPGMTAPVKGTYTGVDVSAVAHSYNQYGYRVGFVWLDLQHVNGRYIAVGQPWNLYGEDAWKFHIAVSYDAVNWDITEVTTPTQYVVNNTANYPNPTIAFCDGYYLLTTYYALDSRDGSNLIRSKDLTLWEPVPADDQRSLLGWGIGAVNGTLVTTTIPEQWRYAGGDYVLDPPHPIYSPTRLAYATDAALDWQVATLNAPNALGEAETGEDGTRQWSSLKIVGASVGASVAAAGDGFPSTPTEPDCNGCSWTGKERQYRPSRSVTQARTQFIQGPHPVFSRGKKSFFDEV